MTGNQLPGAVAQRCTATAKCIAAAAASAAAVQRVTPSRTFHRRQRRRRSGAVSHRWPERPSPYPEGKPVEINAGDALIWNGNLWRIHREPHRCPRPALAINFCARVRAPASNQQLSIPRGLVLLNLGCRN